MRYCISAFLMVCAMGSAHSQPATCDILAKNIRQDVLLQGSVADQFSAHQANLCDIQNSDWSTAKAKSFNGSLLVPDYVDLVVGTKSSEQNWSQNFKLFCSLEQGAAVSNQRISNEIRKASDVAYAKVVDCVQTLAEQNGIYGILTVSDRRDSFTIQVQHKTSGSSRWEIRGVNAAPYSQRFECQEQLHKTSLDAPRVIDTASFQIVCEKDPKTSLLVTVNTSQGPLPTYRVSSFDDELESLKSRLAVIESNLVQPGSVGWFERADCPNGWDVYSAARGRTIVGAGNFTNRDQRNAIISNFTLSGVGGEESHLLSVEEMPAHKHTIIHYARNTYEMNPNKNGGLSPGPGPGESIYKNVEMEASGGNMPHNNMPPFVALTPCIKR